jgi:flavin reductase (DIM6/NTAB) family NADH-FMN oxidoreductase RutF
MHAAALPPIPDHEAPGNKAPDDVDSVAPRRLRAALGLFATGVTIVTTFAESGEPMGLTVNSFNSVSLDPPLVLWSLGLRSGALAAFERAERYAIHVLSADQKDLAELFAKRGADRFGAVQWTVGDFGAPVLAGAAALFECRARSRHVEGDHVILVGEVLQCSSRAQASPLIFHGGRFYTELPL